MLARTVIPANLARKMDEPRTFCRTCVGGQIGSDGGWRAITRLGHAAAALAPRITFEHDAACQTQDVSGTFKGNLRMRNSAAGLHARRCSACTHGCYLLRQPCGAAQAFYHSPEYRHAQREQCVGAGTFNLPCAEGMWVIRNLSGRLPASH